MCALRQFTREDLSIIIANPPSQRCGAKIQKLSDCAALVRYALSCKSQ